MTKLERAILQTINIHFPDEGTLAGDPDSFVEMDQGVVHVSSNKFGHGYFRVMICPCDESEYSKSIWNEDE